MDSIDRRGLLIGTGLALTLAGCGPKGEDNTTTPDAGKPKGPLSKSSFDEQWNYGDDPWASHPTGAAFKPSHLAVLHLELVTVNGEPKLMARRAHFDGVPANDYVGNIALIGRVISHLNTLPLPAPAPSPTPSPTASPSPSPTATPFPGWVLYEGIGGFSFKQAAHLIIYVKNPGIEYGNRAIWFGSRLHDGSPAAKNESFYNAEAHKISGPGSITGGSPWFIYAKNYFHKNFSTTTTPDYKPIYKEDLFYALNINAIIKSHPDGLEIPITIDPDTGNMGSGSGDGTPI